MTFGDAEPEDGWHPDDPVPELLDNLIRRVILLRAAADSRAPYTAADRVRINLLLEDLGHVLNRVAPP